MQDDFQHFKGDFKGDMEGDLDVDLEGDFRQRTCCQAQVRSRSGPGKGLDNEVGRHVLFIIKDFIIKYITLYAKFLLMCDWVYL